jgi:hypothetical protein
MNTDFFLAKTHNKLESILINGGTSDYMLPLPLLARCEFHNLIALALGCVEINRLFPATIQHCPLLKCLGMGECSVTISWQQLFQTVRRASRLETFEARKVYKSKRELDFLFYIDDHELDVCQEFSTKLLSEQSTRIGSSLSQSLQLRLRRWRHTSRTRTIEGRRETTQRLLRTVIIQVKKITLTAASPAIYQLSAMKH